MEIGYIKKRYPLFTQKPSAMDVLYDLEDPFLRFWFRYIYPNTSYLAHVGGEKVFRDRVKPKLQAYFGSCFERLCRDAMPKIYEKMGVHTNYEIGEFWNKDLQIDVVGIRLGIAILIDCKHWKRYSASSLSTAVKKQIARTKHYVSKTPGAMAVPVIVTLYQDKINFIENVPIVPIFQLSSFVDEFYGNLDRMNTIETDSL